jgi:hypothetical protein
VTTFYRPTTRAFVPAVQPFNAMRGLIGQGDSIYAQIDKAIDALPPEKKAIVGDITFEGGVISAAVGMKVTTKGGDEWRVMFGADFKESGPALKFEIKGSF